MLLAPRIWSCMRRKPLVFSSIRLKTYHHQTVINSCSHRCVLSKNDFKKCDFHTTPRRDIPPALVILFKPITRIAAFLFGKLFKRWWNRQTPEKKEMYRRLLFARRGKIYGALGFFIASLLVGYGYHMEIEPLTGRTRLILLNQEQQNQLGKLTFNTHIEEHQHSIVPVNHRGYTRLAKIVQRLLDANRDLPQVRNREWTVTVVNSEMKNAYVLPNGNIFVFLGLLQLTENDDQLAMVLAHEIAHILLLHPIEQVSRNILLDILFIVPLTVVWAIFPDMMAIFLQVLGINLTNALLTFPYSRRLENEADNVGIKLAAKACYDVRQAVVFWGLMKTLTELNVTPEDIPWLSTHPSHEDRAKNLSAQLDEMIKLRTELGCPKLNPVDPIQFFNALSIKEHEARLRRKGIL